MNKHRVNLYNMVAAEIVSTDCEFEPSWLRRMCLAYSTLLTNLLDGFPCSSSQVIFACSSQQLFGGLYRRMNKCAMYRPYLFFGIVNKRHIRWLPIVYQEVVYHLKGMLATIADDFGPQNRSFQAVLHKSFVHRNDGTWPSNSRKNMSTITSRSMKGI